MVLNKTDQAIVHNSGIEVECDSNTIVQVQVSVCKMVGSQEKWYSVCVVAQENSATGIVCTAPSFKPEQARKLAEALNEYADFAEALNETCGIKDPTN